MIVTLIDRESNIKRRISPMGDGLNFVVQRTTNPQARSGKEIKNEYGKPEAYTSTLEHAVEIAVHKFLLESTTQLGDMVVWEKETTKAIAKAVKDRVNKIVAEVSYEQDAQGQGIVPECSEQDES